MKFIKLMGIVALFLITTAGTCKKESNNNTNPVATIDEIKLIGKWEAVSVTWNYYKADGTFNYGSTNSINDPDFEEAKRAWLTFSSDYTYLHTKNDGTPRAAMLDDAMAFEGTWALAENNTVLKTIAFDTISWHAQEFSGSKMLLQHKETRANGTVEEILLEFRK